MTLGESLAVWSARLAMCAYVAAIVRRLHANSIVTESQSTRSLTTGRGLWTTACGLLALHIAVAFQLVHGWSHERAFHATARQTEQLLGVASGWGLYVNYACLLVWLADVIGWWLAPASRATRSRWLFALTDGFLAFIVVNATIVFGSPTTRWVSGAIAVALVVMWWRFRRR